MSTTYYVAVPETKIIYSLGTIHAAVNTFPLLLKERISTETFFLYPDGGYMEDEFVYDNTYDEVHFDVYTTHDIPWLEKNKFSPEMFVDLLDKYHGKDIKKENCISL